MDSVMRVKKSLSTPIKKLSSCVSALKRRRLCAKRRNRKRRGRGGGCNRSGRPPPPRPPPQNAHPKGPFVVRSYHADLERERAACSSSPSIETAKKPAKKLRETANAQKNAQRAAMRAHFRRKYQLSESPKDINHLRSVGGKVSLPHELSKIIHPETKSKDSGFNLLSAFQGLSFDTAALTGRKRGRTSTPTPARGESCKVM